MNDNLRDIGERALLEMFEKLVDLGDLPFNDDAVAYSISKDKSLVINIDTFVRKTDAPPNMTPFYMGWKAVVMAISDLAAKGVQPQVIVASGAFPEDFSVKDTIAIVEGIKYTANMYNAKFLGGDTNTADDVIISIVALGLCKTKNLIKRSGAKNGDIICTTGFFGRTGAGFKVFLEKFSANKVQKENFHQAIYSPIARLEEGLFLSQYGKIHSCIDSSDGLAWSLFELIRNKNDLGIILENIPIDQDVVEFAEKHKLSVEELALYAGEEFELVFTVKEDLFQELQKKMLLSQMRCLKLGKMTCKNPGKIQLIKDSESINISPKGWEHFSK